MWSSPYESMQEDLRCWKEEQAQLLEYEKDKLKQEAVNRLYMVVDSQYAEAFLQILAPAYENEDQYAVEIVNGLNLNDKHMAAFMDDDLKLKCIMAEEREEEDFTCGEE